MKQRIVVLAGLIGAVLVSAFATSYALFIKEQEQEGTNSISTANCFDIEIDGGNVINITNTYPIKDEEGLLTTPYTFKVKNKCSQNLKVGIGLKLNDDNTLSDEKVKAVISNKALNNGSIKLLSDVKEEDSNKYILLNEELNGGVTKEYELRVWVAYDAGEEIKEKVFKASVIVDAIMKTDNTGNDLYIAAYVDGNTSSTFPASENYYTSVACNNADGSSFNGKANLEWSNNEWHLLADIKNGDIKCNAYFMDKDKSFASTILASNTNRTPLTEPGQAVSLENEAVLAATEDDYGTSYYFRGNVNNNYVLFAGKCWRIVRVDGNGNIKLFLWNDSNSCSTNSNAVINGSGTSVFTNVEYPDLPEQAADSKNRTHVFSSNRPAGIGFMYGDVVGTSYASVHANTNDSTILKALKTWYTNTFNTNALTDLLADVIWCGDKSISSGNGTGVEFDTTTYFSAYNRLINTKSPNLKCPNDQNGGNLSRYTSAANTDANNAGGNGALNGYKIGLLTADEAAFAGGAYELENRNYYLYTGSYYWTLSPSYFGASSHLSHVWFVGSTGNLSGNYVTDSFGVRPSVSLVSTAGIAGGTGTASDPYQISV